MGGAWRCARPGPDQPHKEAQLGPVSVRREATTRGRPQTQWHRQVSPKRRVAEAGWDRALRMRLQRGHLVRIHGWYRQGPPCCFP